MDARGRCASASPSAAVIVLWGLSDLMGRRLNFFAILAIVFGFAILSGALKGSSRR